jgi:hypothetical protein
MVEMRNACKILVGKPEGNGPLGRPRSKFKDNIKMDLEDIELDGVNLIYVAQDRDRCRASAKLRVGLRGRKCLDY